MKQFSLAFLWISLVLTIQPLKAREDTPLVIELETEDMRLPLFMASFSVKGTSPLKASYLHSLEDILRFDLSHNGLTICIEKGTNVAYRVTTEIDNSSAKVTMAARGGAVQHISALPLTGDICQDRRQMHLVADAIHKAITDIPGIATTHILYTLRKPTNSGSWESDVWECDYDGNSPRQVSVNAGYCVTPSYLPPKEGFAPAAFLYVSYEAGQPKIYLSPLQTSLQEKRQRLTFLRGNQLMPTISQQRNLMAFICDVNGASDLFLQAFSPEEGLKGDPVQALTAPRSTIHASPTFSPDGSKLAFVSNRGGSPRIYLLSLPPLKRLATQRDAVLISRHCSENSAPSWSPDGTKIAYCAMTDGIRQIWIYDIGNDRETQLTTGLKHKENPSWAPNSRVVVYNTNENDEQELYLVALAYPTPVKISSQPGQKRFPSWEPR